MNDKRRTMVDHALQRAAEGFHVFPVHSIDAGGNCTCGKPNCDSAGKHPCTAKGHLDATTDKAKIKRWWKRWPDANIAAVPGLSGHCVFDFDPWKKGEAEAFDRLEAEHGPLGGAVVLTGEHQVNGHPERGRHYWLRLPQDVSKTKWTVEGIEVKASGGYVLLPPSLHASGVRYDLASESLSDAEAAPGWILDGATGPVVSDESEAQNASRDRTGLPLGKRARRALQHGLPEPEGSESHREVAVGIARNLYEAGHHEDVVRVLMERILFHEASALDPARPWTPQDVEAIVASVAREAAPDAAAHRDSLATRLTPFDLAEIWDEDDEPEWVIPGVFLRGKYHEFVGAMGSGKSLVVLGLIVTRIFPSRSTGCLP